MTENFAIVIAGAGPTGSLLAIELALAGVRPLLLERLEAPDLTIKASQIGALAGEALERRGFADALTAAETDAAASMRELLRNRPDVDLDNPWRRMGGHFAGLFLIDQTRQRSPGRRLRGVKQSVLETMLRERVAALGITVRRGEELVDFAQHEHCVTLQVRNADGVYPLQAQYLVGCDGGRSQVRKRAGFEFVGTDPTLTGYQAVLELDHPERLLPAGWRRTERGTMSYGPTPGRVLLVHFNGPPAARDVPVTREEVEDVLRAISGADVRIERLHQATRWSDNARQATSYRIGRVLLAGDAAHVHSPLGGQGLGLGLIDATNLGWKLAAAVRGDAPPNLLDTYTSERHPVAARVLANTRAQVALLRPDPQTSALREVVSEIMTSDWGTRFFGEMISGLSVRYDLGEAHPDVGTMTANRVVEGASISSLMREGSALLIDGTGDATKLAEPWSARVRCVRTQGQSQLIRPDGCIAWVSEGTEGLRAALTRWFGAA